MLTRREFIGTAATLSLGLARVPTGPGLGIEVDEGRVVELMKRREGK